MNTINVSNSNSLRVVRCVEVGLYVLLATLLISPIFNLSSPFTLQDSLMTLLGETFGLMAVCAASPLAAMSGLLIERGRPVPEEVFESTADILPFVRRNRPDGHSTSSGNDETRRAA